MATNIGTTFAYIVALVGGLIIVLASSINVVWYASGEPNFGGYGSFIGGLMDNYHSFIGTSFGFLAGISLVAVICGVVVVTSAIALRVNPQHRVIWALVIIAFSVVSFVGMGGFFIGALLGIIGGAFVLATRQTNP
jgi:hypothetical protein